MLTNNHDNNLSSVTKRSQNIDTNKVLGFWIYLMSDCILFAVLFAIYIELKDSVIEGLSGKDLYDLSYVLIETFLLLLSSITYGLVMIKMERNDNIGVHIWLGCTFFLGCLFLGMEWYEFYNLITLGYGPNKNAVLSSFFTLVGTHGIHVLSGLIWIFVMMLHLLFHGFTVCNRTRLQCLGLFWHFLDIIWICVVTVVYLLGVIV